MTTLAPQPTITHSAAIPATESLLLRGVRWETYTRLLADFADSHAAHFAYDRGNLEIMVLSLQHEKLKHLLTTLVELLAEEARIDLEGVGSTTFQREDLARGFEADASFYFTYIESIRRKDKIDLMDDPPPDLVIEIDISNPLLDKLPICAAMGVPEIWRYENGQVTIFILEAGTFVQRPKSGVLPGVRSSDLTRFMREGQRLQRPVWSRRIREWVHTTLGQDGD
jgi:Uma2 family endonuclease